MAGPKKGTAFTFGIALTSQGDTDVFQASPTLAAGDITVSLDGGDFANITTLPTQIQTSGVLPVALTAAEMNADLVCVRFHDVAGDEWQDALVVINTETGTISEIDTNVDDLETRLGTPSDLGSGATVANNLADIEGQTATIGAAGAGLTSLGDARLANLDAAISSRATPADVQTSLAVSATEAAAVATGSMALTLYGSFDQTIESDTTEDLSAADALIWAIKLDRKRDIDAEALVLVDVTTGLRYLARDDYDGSAANGSVTVSGTPGDWEIRCQLAKGIPGLLAAWANRNLDAQLKAIFGARTVNVWEGTARIGHQTIREV